MSLPPTSHPNDHGGGRVAITSSALRPNSPTRGESVTTESSLIARYAAANFGCAKPTTA